MLSVLGSKSSPRFEDVDPEIVFLYAISLAYEHALAGPAQQALQAPAASKRPRGQHAFQVGPD